MGIALFVIACFIWGWVNGLKGANQNSSGPDNSSSYFYMDIFD